MAATVPRPFALVRTDDQWSRAAHDGTALDAETGGVELRRVEPRTLHGGAAAPELGGGLAFDAECRLYHSLPAENRVEKLLWSGKNVTVTLEYFRGEAHFWTRDFWTARGAPGS